MGITGYENGLLMSLRSKILLLLFFIVPDKDIKAANYYINAATGKDINEGITASAPWKTIRPLSAIEVKPGDSILFATGQVYMGMLSLIEVHGTLQHPVVITSYPFRSNLEKPVLDAGGELNAILIQNVSNLKISGIEITAVMPYALAPSPNSMRCGILVEITKNQLFQHIEVSDVLIHDIYFNQKGLVRPAGERRTANGTQHYGWGIRFINNTVSGRIIDIKISGMEINNVSHTGLKFTAVTGGIQQVDISGCYIHDTGGPGMQLSGVNDGHIYKNEISHSGSERDSRNWGRGSGLWTWGCTGILIEHNRFAYANGPGDSAGVHIDFNCNDVIVQYNFSANNAGGFCEILGNNRNCAYRYNISVNDGSRIKGVNGAFQEGKIFWLSGYQGNQKKNYGPFNSYFYNNTIYVDSGITPKISVSSSAEGILIANNIFYFEKNAMAVMGDQKKSEEATGRIPRVVFSNNIYTGPDSWPKNFLIEDRLPLIGDPSFRNKGGSQLQDYIPANKVLVKDKGVIIKPIPADDIGIRIGISVQYDIMGNPITGNPDIGAIEIETEN